MMGQYQKKKYLFYFVYLINTKIGKLFKKKFPRHNPVIVLFVCNIRVYTN